eukprot:8096485-Pyramimonas_sp.AAC.1
MAMITNVTQQLLQLHMRSQDLWEEPERHEVISHALTRATRQKESPCTSPTRSTCRPTKLGKP